MEDKKRKREEAESTPEMERRLIPIKEHEAKPSSCGWHSLPAEMGSLILSHATQAQDRSDNASAQIVCRFVVDNGETHFPVLRAMIPNLRQGS